MTDKTNPERPTAEPDLARFLQDWTTLWQQEAQTVASEPAGMMAGIFGARGNGTKTPDLTSALEFWRAAMLAWASASGASAASGAPGASGASGLGAERADLSQLLSYPALPLPLMKFVTDPSHSGSSAPQQAARMGWPGMAAPAEARDAIAPRAEALAVTSDARDAEVERLTRRVAELEARLAKLETTRRRRS